MEGGALCRPLWIFFVAPDDGPVHTPTVNILVVSTSLNPGSRSRILARHALQKLEQLDAIVDFIDLRDTPLPICDGDAAYSDPRVEAARLRLDIADGILVACPIYNYSINAALKNLIELTGNAWEGKVVGFLCAAGGASSYMSVMSIANSLMLDFRSIIVPRFVYASGSAFDGKSITDPEVAKRVDQLAADLARFVRALHA